MDIAIINALISPFKYAIHKFIPAAKFAQKHTKAILAYVVFIKNL
jgi:hypothetical protein